MPRTSGFFVNIGSKFLLADPKEPKSQKGVAAFQLQPGPGLTSLATFCCQQSPSELFSIFFSGIHARCITFLKNNLVGQLEVITDNYLLAGGIKSWRERIFGYQQLHPIPSYPIWPVFIPSQYARKTVSTCVKLLNKNLEMVSGFDETLHRCLVSFLASHLSPDFFVAPTSNFPLHLSTILCNPPQVLVVHTFPTVPSDLPQTRDPTMLLRPTR